MSFRQTTDYGLDPFARCDGPQFTGVVDRLIGNAFPIVKRVHDHLEVIKYVAFNLEAIILTAQQFQINNPQVLAATILSETAAATAVTNAATVAAAAQAAATQTQLNAWINAWMSSLPVWSGTGPLPVNTGGWFLNNGKPEQAQ